MSVLERIVAKVAERLAETKRRVPVAELRSVAEASPRPASFRAAIEAKGTSLIAEASTLTVGNAGAV